MMIEAVNLYKSFKNPKADVLKGINLTLNPRETLAIMGASGEGKSTLLHILGTLDTQDSGDLILFGEKVNHKTSHIVRSNQIGFVFQSFYLIETASVLQNILMPALIAKKSTKKDSKAYQRALYLLDEVGLSHRSHFQAKYLSGGEKQRACIARALMNNPSIIIADEPTGNLDTVNSYLIQELLIKSCEKEDKALLLATHDETFAKSCQKKLILKEGLLH